MLQQLSTLQGEQRPINASDTEKECGLEFVVPGKSDREFNETSSVTTNDDNATAAASDTVNASTTGSVYNKHCALVGSGWLYWYPAARPVFGFVVYYVVPMLLIAVLYGRVVCKLLTTSTERHGSADRERKHAARSLLVSQLIFSHTV